MYFEYVGTLTYASVLQASVIPEIDDVHGSVRAGGVFIEGTIGLVRIFWTERTQLLNSHDMVHDTGAETMIILQP